MRRYLPLTLILVLIIILGGIMVYSNIKKPDNRYQPATLHEIEQNKEKFDNVRVEIGGTYEHMFETENIDGKIWLNITDNTIFLPADAKSPTFTHARVRVQGMLFTKEGNYGHLNMYSYLLIADRIEILGIQK